MAHPSGARRVLIIANRTAATPGLLEEVRRRAAEGATLELAIPLLEEAAGGRVEGLIGDQDPVRAVESALAEASYDEIILSTLPERVSRWLHMDLPTRLHRFGLPVTLVTARKADRPLTQLAKRA